jgi:hypothetical protein
VLPAPHSEPVHVPHVAACHSCTSTVVYRSKHVVQVAEGVEWIVFRVGSTALVVSARHATTVKHVTNLSYRRVQPLLKCAPSCRVRTLWMDGEARGHTLNAAGRLPSRPYHTARHPSASVRVTVAAPSRRTLVRTQWTRGSGWPHTAVKQDCHKVTHPALVTIRPPASSCQLHRGSHSTAPLNSVRRAGFTHVSLGGG